MSRAAFHLLRLPFRSRPLSFGNVRYSHSRDPRRQSVPHAQIYTAKEAHASFEKRPLTLYYSDHYEYPLPPNHRFPMQKYALVRKKLQELQSDRFRFKPAPLAKRLDLELAHSSSYITRFFQGKQTNAEQRATGFPWSLAGVRRALGSTGGTVAATREAIQFDTICGHLAGGTHHAKRNQGGGFCIFNDLAVASLVALRDFDIRRVLLIDLDVHQGDGSAEIFAEDDRVFTVSIHGENNYPFDKMKSDMDVGLTDGAGDVEVLDVIQRVVPQVFDRVQPDFVGLQMGVDMLNEDALGRLAMTREGLRERNRIIYQYVLELGIPAVISMGGGYSNPIDDSVHAHADVYEDAAEALEKWYHEAAVS